MRSLSTSPGDAKKILITLRKSRFRVILSQTYKSDFSTFRSLIECGDAGSTRTLSARPQRTKIVTDRQFLDILAESGS
jgi:hypothetical protein